jgi:Icc-related predicted phosphoesterase
MKLVIVSDTHLHEIDPPDGDLLVHCGDLTMRGTAQELRAVNRTFGRIKGRYAHGILYIAGNHDFLFQRDRALAETLVDNGRYLADEGCTIGGVSFWGSPWTPTFFDWAFMADDDQLAPHWDLIPRAIDVLITHGPPLHVLDMTTRGEAAGSATLLRAVERVAPAVHCFGHIHEAYGELERNGTRFINASSCDVDYRLANGAFELDLSDRAIDAAAGR